jgi:hypothetical protein
MRRFRGTALRNRPLSFGARGDTPGYFLFCPPKHAPGLYLLPSLTERSCRRMGWVETVTSLFGTSTAGGMMAVVIYAGAGRFEKDIRAEAKKDIARFINNTSISADSATISDFILHVFENIFTTRHWTISCIRRSVIASIIFLTSMLIIQFVKNSSNWWYKGDLEIYWLIGVAITFSVLVPDYLSLYKSRIILRAMANRPSFAKIMIFLSIDVLCAIVISICFLAIGDVMASYLHGMPITIKKTSEELMNVARYLDDYL